MEKWNHLKVHCVVALMWSEVCFDRSGKQKDYYQGIRYCHSNGFFSPLIQNSRLEPTKCNNCSNESLVSRSESKSEKEKIWASLFASDERFSYYFVQTIKWNNRGQVNGACALVLFCHLSVGYYFLVHLSF